MHWPRGTTRLEGLGEEGPAIHDFEGIAPPSGLAAVVVDNGEGELSASISGPAEVGGAVDCEPARISSLRSPPRYDARDGAAKGSPSLSGILPSASGPT